MNDIVERLKDDTFNAIFRLTGKSWFPTGIAYSITTVVSALVFILAAMGLGISEKHLNIFRETSTDPMTMQKEIEQFKDVLMANFSSLDVLLMVAVFLLMMLMGAWVYMVSYETIKQVVKGRKPHLGTIISQSINGRVISMFGASLLVFFIFIVLYVVVLGLVGLLMNIHPALGVLFGMFGLFAMVVILWRFMPAMAIVAYDDMPLTDAFMTSFNGISYGKGAKYTMISILATLGIMVVFFILLAITGIIGFIPIIGQFIGMLVMALFYGFIVTLFCAATVALYHKYFKEDNENELDSLA